MSIFKLVLADSFELTRPFTVNRNMDGIDRKFTYFQEIIPAKKKSERGGGVVSIHQVLVVEM